MRPIPPLWCNFALLLGLCACNPLGGTITKATVDPHGEMCAAKWTVNQIYQQNDVVSVGAENWRATQTLDRQVPLATRFGRSFSSGWVRVGKCVEPNGSESGGSANSNTPTATGSVIPNFILSPYKGCTVAFDEGTHIISTEVNGTKQAVLDSAPTLPALTWAFVVGECGQETFEGMDAQALATANVPLWAAAKKPYIISTGGAGSSFTCDSDDGFTAFLERYYSPYLAGIDFDIENNQTAAQITALVQRVKTAQANPKYANLRFSFTLATSGGTTQQGLSTEGVNTMKAIAAAGLKSYLIDLMVMDYGSNDPGNCTLNSKGTCDMGASAVQAAKNLQAAYQVPYNQMELTPMIGGNDIADEIFSLTDLTTMMNFVKQVGIAGVHWWSFDRDRDCTGKDTPTSSVCSGTNDAGPLGFLTAFLNALK